MGTRCGFVSFSLGKLLSDKEIRTCLKAAHHPSIQINGGEYAFKAPPTQARKVGHGHKFVRKLYRVK